MRVVQNKEIYFEANLFMRVPVDNKTTLKSTIVGCLEFLYIEYFTKAWMYSTLFLLGCLMLNLVI